MYSVNAFKRDNGRPVLTLRILPRTSKRVDDTGHARSIVGS